MSFGESRMREAEHRFNATAGHVGAYPTYSIGGRMSLRPVSGSSDNSLTTDKRRVLDEECVDPE